MAASARPACSAANDGAPNEVIVSRQGGEYMSPHWSKDEDIRLVDGRRHHRAHAGRRRATAIRGGATPPSWRATSRAGTSPRRTRGPDYGVVLTGEDPPTVDARATEQNRRQRAGERRRG